MKKAFAICAMCILLFTAFCLSSSAATLEGDAEKCAEALYELDLFRGTDKGFELEKSMTRAEAAVLTVRLIGEEKTALNGKYSHPFTDVPQWADNYVGWLYENEVTNGVSETLFGSNQPITAEQYALLITRATQEYESIPYELITPAEISKTDEGNGFVRGDAAIVSVRTLSLRYRKSFGSPIVAEFLVDEEIFSAEELDKAVGDIIGYNYRVGEYVYRTLCDVDVAKSQLGGFEFQYDDTPICGKDNIIAYRKTGEVYTMYSVDKQTLQATKLGKRRIADDFDYQVLFELGETTFIRETSYPGRRETYAILAVKGREMREVLRYNTIWDDKPRTYYGWDSFTDSESALFVNDGKYFFVTEESMFEHTHNFTDVIDFKNGYIFAMRINDKSTDLMMIDAKTRETVTKYSVDDDRPDDSYINRDLDDRGNGKRVYFSGEAGLYYFDGNTFNQITDMPVNDFTIGDDGFYVVTHEPGLRLGGSFVRDCGNIIKKLSLDGAVDESFSPIKNIGYSIVAVYHKDGVLHFRVCNDINFIARLEENGEITVLDVYSATVAKIEDILSANNKTREEAIRDIQKTIDDIGY